MSKQVDVTSIKVNPSLWKQAKIEAIKQDITLREVLDQALKEWIEKHKYEGKIDGSK